MSLPNGRYRTVAGSEVVISGRHGGRAEVTFDWLEELSACPDCVVDPYPHDGELTWECDHCGGGSAALHRVRPGRAPVVHTMEPGEAHPLHLLATRWLALGTQLAAALARSGRFDEARAVRDHVDAGRPLVARLPRLKNAG